MAVYFGFVVISLLQQPGRTTYDTRLELTERPGSFLASAFSLWQPDVNFGEVQNQANGYLFPQGPFFGLAHVIGIAPWVAQRLWTALIIVAACEGLRRVGRALDLPPSAAFLGGLVFAFSPRLIGTSGVLTGEALPGALAPWALLPIMLATRGRLAGRPAVVLSAAAAVSMGGVNAVETGAALVPTAVLMLWAASRRIVGWRLAGGWVGVIALGTLWWTLPLLVLGRYSPPFYEYVESAATTTSLVGWSEAVRGDTHWLSWLLLPDGTPWWPAAHFVATDAALVIVSAAIAAAGLVGLARWRSQYRVPFAFSAAIGLAVITIAHGGAAGTPLAGGARTALDGSLQIFRNVHKFDPAVRIAVAIGAAALFAELVELADRRFSRGAAAKWVVVPACVVMSLGTPDLLNEGRTPGWSSVPTSWTSARDWLAKHGDGGAVLIVPGSGFALQQWGSTFDEPALAPNIPHRVALTQAPLLPGASLRYLSALNQSITSAKAADLADELRRAGVSHVILRKDLDTIKTGTPGPAPAESVLASPGIEKVATFGRGSVAPLTVYRVDRQQPRLRATPVADVLTVAGQSESVLALQEAGVLHGAVVLKGERGWNHPTDVVTDGSERRERQFGNVYGAQSVVLQQGEPYRVARAAHDYSGVPGASQVVATYDGLASLRASSSRGYADTYGDVVLAEGPAAAIDHSPGTRWVSSPGTEPTRQWLRMVFGEPDTVHDVVVQPVVGDPFLAPVRRIEVVAGSQRRILDVSPDGGAVTAHFDGRRVASVTVRILRVGTDQARAPVALADVRVDDRDPRASLRVPEPLEPGVGFVFRTDPGARPCISATFAPDCDERRRRTPEEPDGLDRTVTVRDPDTVVLAGSVVARTTRRALRLLEPVGREQRVHASSVLGNDPKVSSRFAWDGSPDTAWVPADTDPGPTLVFRWKTPRAVSGIRVASPDPQARPTRAVVSTGEGEQVAVNIAGSATAAFPTLRTRRLEVTFQRPEKGARLVVGDVELRGADATQPFDPNAVTGAICGLGPHVVIDGAVYQSQVRGTLRDIVDGRPLHLSVCNPDDPGAQGPRIRLGPGVHRISAPPTSEFQPTLVAGQPPTARTVHSERSVELASWEGTHRSARVGPGSATVVSMPANANPGWRARLDGRQLASVRVNGWQQGWVIPAGPGGQLVIDFPPQRWYRTMIIGGLVPAGLVVLSALLLLIGRRRIRRHAAPEPQSARPGVTAAAAAFLLLALGGLAAIGAAVAWVGRRRDWPLLLGGLAVLASGLLDARDTAVPVDGIADLLAAGGFGLLFVMAIAGPKEKP
jgi:arabinofuranan 3-O-arabinosyltransferase